MSDFWTGRFLYASPNTPTDIAVARQTLALKGITDYSEFVVFAEARLTGTPPPPPPPPPVPGHNFAPRTHQSVINLFLVVFGSSYFSWIIGAGLEYIANNRSLIYNGPDIEALTLTDAQKAALIAAL